MYPISKDALTALKNDVQQNVEIKCTLTNGSVLMLTDENLKGKAVINRASLTGDKIEIGSAVMADLSFTLENHTGKFNNVKFEGAQLDVKVKFPVNGTPFTVPMGHFTVDAPPRKLSTINIKALDNMAKFDRVYDTDLTYPATLYTIVQNACTKCGVYCALSPNTLNAKMEIPTKPTTDDKLTYRQVLIWCAQFMGVCLYINREGQLDGKWYSATGDMEISEHERYSGKTDFAEDTIKTTGVVVEMNDENKTTVSYGNKDYAYHIKGNGFAQDNAQVATIADNLFKNRIISYRPMSCNVLSFPHIDPLDGIKFKKSSSKNLLTYPYASGSYVELFNGRMKITVSGEGKVNIKSDGKPLGGYQNYVLNWNIPLVPEKTYRTSQQVTVQYRVKGSIEKKWFTWKYPFTWKSNYILEKCYIDFVPTDKVTELNLSPQLEEGTEQTDYRPYDGFEFNTIATNVNQILTGNTTLMSKGKTLTQAKYATSSPFTPQQSEIIEQNKNIAHKEVSDSEIAALELNKTIANANGLYVTQRKDETGATITYYHNLKKLEDSDTIYCRNAGGYAWTVTGWNNGNPTWNYGFDKNGNMVMRSISTYKLNADLITTGELRSPTGKFGMNLITGHADFSDIGITGGDIDLYDGIFKIRTERFGLDLSSATIEMYNAPTTDWNESKLFSSFSPVIIKDKFATVLDWYLALSVNGNYDDGAGHKCLGYRIGENVSNVSTDVDDPWQTDWVQITKDTLEARGLKSRSSVISNSTFISNEKYESDIMAGLTHYRKAQIDGKTVKWYTKFGNSGNSGKPTATIEVKDVAYATPYDARMDMYEKNNYVVLDFKSWAGGQGSLKFEDNVLYTWNGSAWKEVLTK